MVFTVPNIIPWSTAARLSDGEDEFHWESKARYQAFYNYLASVLNLQIRVTSEERAYDSKTDP